VWPGRREGGQNSVARQEGSRAEQCGQAGGKRGRTVWPGRREAFVQQNNVARQEGSVRSAQMADYDGDILGTLFTLATRQIAFLCRVSTMNLFCSA